MGRELKAVGFVTLYFLFCFGIILTLKKLFLADYRVEVYALSTAVVSALVAAKVVVALDHTRAGTRFDASRALLIAVSYKTLIYGAVAFGVVFAEKLFHAYGATGELEAAMADVWTHRDRNVIFAKVICVGLTFAGYHLYTAIDRRLGEGALRRIVTGGRSESTAPTKETRHGQTHEAQHSRHLG
ncbi:MAG: hypothetical protein ACREKS_14070 [Candidatus Rokuibacteriota bacterium]